MAPSGCTQSKELGDGIFHAVEVVFVSVQLIYLIIISFMQLNYFRRNNGLGVLYIKVGREVYGPQSDE